MVRGFKPTSSKLRAVDQPVSAFGFDASFQIGTGFDIGIQFTGGPTYAESFGVAFPSAFRISPVPEF